MCVLAEFELVDDLLDDGRIGLDIFDTFRGDGVNLGLSDSWRFEGLQ
jgi:hypothetical protein